MIRSPPPAPTVSLFVGEDSSGTKPRIDLCSTTSYMQAPITVPKFQTVSHAEVKRAQSRRLAADLGVGDTVAASVVGSNARGGIRGDMRFPVVWPQCGRERRTVRQARLRVGERMNLNESRLREIRTLSSTRGERKRGQAGD